MLIIYLLKLRNWQRGIVMKINLAFNVEHQLGARIRFLRTKSKLTIEELSLKANVNTSYLSDLERGRRNPTIKVLSRIAEALEITLSDLLLGVSGVN